MHFYGIEIDESCAGNDGARQQQQYKEKLLCADLHLGMRIYSLFIFLLLVVLFAEFEFSGSVQLPKKE